MERILDGLLVVGLTVLGLICALVATTIVTSLVDLIIQLIRWA